MGLYIKLPQFKMENAQMHGKAEFWAFSLENACIQMLSVFYVSPYFS